MDAAKILPFAVFQLCAIFLPMQWAHAAEAKLTAIEASAGTAHDSVFRVMCPQTNSEGTAFLYNSTLLLTASHVVENCTKPQIRLQNGTIVPADVQAFDDGPDMAALRPDTPITGKTFHLAKSGSAFRLGEEVVTWGFPGGYQGREPFLSVGYFGGVNPSKDKENRPTTKYIINAAFNHGNSGGPLISTETGDLIGIVTDKLIPFNQRTLNAISALQSTKSGLQYERPNSGQSFSEAQVVSMVLYDLMQNAQIVVGMATTSDDVRKFLRDNHLPE
ncbi:hypothetical protein AAJCM20276_27450 [Acetobacter aceti]|uniref:Serine protease n=1 Tax=Acetobacter aceti TaxID=435 RepID=A0A6S6PN56_ACEAC|nr:serine protease [Acetobacter aceti]BCI68121.1 hypothetical protein AAJCM20276_27450 [Acetobacter aceti]